jgi:hypothetical protein
MPSNSTIPLTCWICGRPVSLEACVIDEHGMAVHEECSVEKIAARANGSLPVRGLPSRTRPPN